MIAMEACKREAKRRLLSFLHGISARIEMRRVNAELDRYNTDIITNKCPEKIDSILFIITRMVRFSGGQTSILRLGTELSKRGYKVGYAVYKQQSKQEMELCASSNLKDFKGELYTMQELSQMLKSAKKANGKSAFPQFDAVVASSWDTVSYVKQFTGYRMYFVQDYEPYFYSFGELFLLAKKTYDQGLHMVSLGGWNKEIIEKNCNPVSQIDVIDFPYEKKEYIEKKRDFTAYRGKKRFVIAVYLKYYGKRLPCILQYMISELKKEGEKEGIQFDIKYYGEAKSFSVNNGTNLGMLDKVQLRKLYETADFGMVASMSNISLVPYEMLATGLPLIEFEEGTFSYFFPKESAILTSISAHDLFVKLKQSIENPELLQKRQTIVREYLKSVSWEKTAKQFQEVLRRVCGD